MNQLGKFSPSISELTQPLRELLSTRREWLWGPEFEQDRAFSNVKEELSKPLYNPEAELKISVLMLLHLDWGLCSSSKKETNENLWPIHVRYKETICSD